MRVKHMTDEELEAIGARVVYWGGVEVGIEVFEPFFKKGSTVPVYEFGEDDELSS